MSTASTFQDQSKLENSIAIPEMPDRETEPTAAATPATVAAPAATTPTHAVELSTPQSHPAFEAGTAQLEAETASDEALEQDEVPAKNLVYKVNDLNVYYGDYHALRNVDLEIEANEITAFIGPSGCGKTTLLRCFNRMNDLIPTARIEGMIEYLGVNLYDSQVSAVEVRRRIGMVFQKPNPFPKSIFDNVAYGPRITGLAKRGQALNDIVERSLQKAALFDEVKDRLNNSAMGLSGGQQQRLCIARAIAVNPDVLLMDEPCSALDPVATTRIEDLMNELKQDYTIVIVTHNMQQAARVSDMTAFFSVDVASETDTRTGILVEYGKTEEIFSTPKDTRTEHYVTGRFG